MLFCLAQTRAMIALVTVPAVTCSWLYLLFRANSHPASTLAKAISLQGRVQCEIKHWWLTPIPRWSRVRDLSCTPSCFIGSHSFSKNNCILQRGDWEQGNVYKPKQKKKGHEGWQERWQDLEAEGPGRACWPRENVDFTERLWFATSIRWVFLR